MRSACLAHLILHDLTTAIFGEEYTNYGEPHYTIFSLQVHRFFCSSAMKRDRVSHRQLRITDWRSKYSERKGGEQCSDSVKSFILSLEPHK
jgi:hypothetical protein